MADFQVTINSQIIKLVSIGFCACGCDRKTTISSDNFHGGVKGQPRRFILGHYSKGRSGERNSGWKGGITNGGNGYKKAYCPEHPRSSSQGYVAEHILVAERALGKPLPKDAQVHHSNEKRGENQNSNLVICQDNAYHRIIHRRKRAYDTCGHASWRKCPYCKRYDDIENMVIPKGGHSAHHNSCKNDHDRLRKND